MTIERVIKERGRKLFLVRNTWNGNGMFALCQGAIYRLYDDHGDLWMTIAVRRTPGHGIVATDMDSGMLITAAIGRNSYDDAVREVVRQQEFIDKARAKEFYEDAVKLCQEEYAELRERGVLK